MAFFGRHMTRFVGAMSVLLLALLPIGVIAKTVVPADDGQRYYDIYLLDNRVCRKCAAYWTAPDQVMLLNRAGQSIVVRGLDIVGADTQPIKRRFLQSVLKNIDLPGRVIVPQWYDPMQGWRDEYRNSPPPSKVNEPVGGDSY